MDSPKSGSSQNKLLMWYKVRELESKGLNKTQIGYELGLHRGTVRKYLKMSLEEFLQSQAYQRNFIHKLERYEEYVSTSLELHPYLSSSQIYDWLREQYSDFPEVNTKTVYNFVKYVRAKYKIPKEKVDCVRQYEKIEETVYGEYAQVDFGEYWMKREDERRVKVYFFVMVLCRSRKKFIYFSRTPFTSDLAIYAHELAFSYYGGKPKKIIYDQDKVFIHGENLGDVILTKVFQRYLTGEHFESIFCRKSDPESKGKVENVVKYVKYNFLRGRIFNSIEKTNEQGIAWLKRTANGLVHNGTKLVPDEVFKEEQKHLMPYYGIPMFPARKIEEYCVRKDNTILYHGNFYSVPTGTHENRYTKIWVNENEDFLELYNKETGKQIARHKTCNDKGQFIVDRNHRRKPLPNREEIENKTINYLGRDCLAITWLDNLYKDKPRYYKSNLNYLNKNIEFITSDTLHKAFEICLDKGVYNAKDLINLCDRLSKRKIVVSENSIVNNLPEAALQIPKKTNINNYKTIFE